MDTQDATQRLRQRAESIEWVCPHCKKRAEAGKYCPGCGSHRLVSLIEIDAQDIVDRIDELQAENAALRAEIAQARAWSADMPTVVCLCGSTRFFEEFRRANFEETLAGRIVLTIGCDTKADGDLFTEKTPEELESLKYQLDWLHKRKIDIADEVLILNKGGYIGTSTRSELEYARQHSKRVRWLEASPDVLPSETVEEQEG
jgi:RNA polymerase subunit RPABC4/transcription elongation factor Spt4